MSFILATTLGDLLLDAAEKWPDQHALIVPERKLTYRQLAENARHKAQSLLELGVKPGSHVGVLMPNVVETVEWIFAITLTGAVTVMINARYKLHELTYVITHADLQVLVTTNCIDDQVNYLQLICSAVPELKSLANNASLSLASAPLLRQVVVDGHVPDTRISSVLYSEDLDHYAAQSSSEALWYRRNTVGLSDPCMMLYTSGTTSLPKGCRLNHESIVRTAIEISGRLRITDQDRQWNPLPLFHLASVMPMLATFVKGGAYIFSTHFEASSAWDMIEKEKATILYPAFPTIMSDLLVHPKFHSIDLSSIRLISNVAPPKRLLENMRMIPNAVHISAYGLTEASGLSCYSDLDDDSETRANMIGPALPGVQIKTADPETAEEMNAGERGEMLIRGFSVFDGYYGAADKAADVFDDDGWFHTGDLCSIDEQGRVSFHGRLKDILKVGGENVSALEVESYLSLHPAVKLAQVVGAPDDRLDEVVAAFVELNPRAKCTEDELIGYCQGNIATFKIPKYVRFVTEWPMSSTKVKKIELKKMIANSLLKN